MLQIEVCQLFEDFLFMFEGETYFQVFVCKYIQLVLSKFPMHIGVPPGNQMDGNIKMFLKQRTQLDGHRPICRIVERVQSNSV